MKEDILKFLENRGEYSEGRTLYMDQLVHYKREDGVVKILHSTHPKIKVGVYEISSGKKVAV